MSFRGSLCAALTVAFAVVAAVAEAQLAFPGAEGAGQNAIGGRNGDVYYVTNLNDSGAGSLRTGISTAPATGRTILFKVGGAIHLTSDLKINKPLLTIAGQSAPGGGIEIADREVDVDNTHDVIVQYLRFRVGTKYTLPTNPTGYGPDSFGVTSSSNVMVDHVSASWSIDENLSVTHDSNNITVQWSTISEALKNAGHPKGAHSYGSLINGGNITYAHNLYADNDSRNPRPEGAGDTTIRPGTLNLDFVNNVIENPGQRFGYSGNNVDSNDDYRMNYVGNYGISGPSTTANGLFYPASTASQIFVPAGTNFLDSNKNGVLNNTAASGSQLMNGTFANSATRFDGGGGLPVVTTYDADHAYIQVLSHAGANFYRDPVDRRVIRNVINQRGAIIDTTAQGGDYPTLPTGTAPTDTNSDGVPDFYAVANGFNTTTDIHKTVAGNGYTYLENYLQSVNAKAYPTASTQAVAISTGFGHGADAFLSENGGASATSSGDGSGATLDATWGGSAGTTNQVVALKFDLSKVVPSSLTDATLNLTAASAITGTHNFTFYGLEHDATGFDWNEASVQFNGGPALGFDGNSGTLGINDPSNTGDPAILLRLGTLNLTSTVAQGSTVSFTNPNLAVFLNLAANFAGTAEDGLVTILLQQTNSGSVASFVSKEGDANLAPQLSINAALKPVAALAGDYNGDHIVDAIDYTLWRDSYGQTGTGLAADGDHSGKVDDGDYTVWFNNFGMTTSGADGLASGQVPEPTSAILAGIAILGLLAVRITRPSVGE